MTRRAALVIGVLVAVAACRRAPARQMMLVAGSTAMRSYTEQLVNEFSKREPDTTVVVESGGVAAGVIALKRGAIDVATMTRDFSDREDDPDLRNYLVARDGIAILVNPANPVANLTMAQLRSIYAQEITSWKDVGGPDAPIDIIVREPTAHTQRSVREVMLGGDEMPKGRVADGRAAMIATVKTDPNAIGFAALAGVSSEVKVVAVDGVAITRLSILSGRYPLARSFYLVLYGAATPAAERLVTFALSKDGQALLEKDGLLAVY